MEHKQITYYLMIFITIISLSISLATYIKVGKTSCNDCIIDFKTVEQSGMKLEKIYVIEEKLENLYNGLKEDRCVVGWDRSGGYRRNGFK